MFWSTNAPIILYIYYWKVHKSSTHKNLYTNTHKICGPKLRPFLQPSLRWILKKEQRHWFPYNLKYVGKIRYRILHPFFFFHFLDAKATMCWLSEKCWLNVDFETVFHFGLPFLPFRRGKNFSFFFQEKSSLRSFVKKRLRVFSYLKQVLFEVSEKRLEMNAGKKKSKCICQLWKKSFLKTREIPFWYPYDTREHQDLLLNLKEHSFLMIQSGRFISDKSNHLKIKP